LTLLVGRQEGHPACKKTEWWGAGVVICLERGADLHMAQLMPLPLSLASVKSRLVLPFWYRLTQVVPDNGPINGCSNKQPSQNTHPFNGPLSGTTQVSRYRKSKTNLDFTEAIDSEWQWHQLGHMQICTSLQAQSTEGNLHKKHCLNNK